MYCYKCKYYRSGMTDNKCLLTKDENFRTPNREHPCTCIDDNYCYIENDPYMGWKKGEKAKQ